MPDVSDYDSEDKWMSACVPKMIDEGKEQEQAVAACLGMWRNKELDDEDKAIWTTSYINDLPDSAFLYVETGEKDGDGKTAPRSKRHFPYKDASGKVDLAHVRNAISRLSQPKTGEGWLSDSLRAKLLSRARKLLASEGKSLLDRLTDTLKSLFGIDGEPDEETAATVEKEGEPFIGVGSPAPLMVWKSGNEWLWASVFTNRYRDRDDPPEILTDASHRDFEKAVDSGEWPMPELWPWHVPYRIGVAQGVAYDDRGFTIAIGTFDDAVVGERFSMQGNLGTSHGMPTKEIRRDADDPTLITRYRTREISPLPLKHAANPFTGFVSTGGMTMALSEEKAAWLHDVLGDERALQVERMIEDKAKETEGVEFKDAEEPAELESEAKGDLEPTKESEAPLTRDEIADAIAGATSPLYEQFETLVGEIAGLKAAIKALHDAEEEREKEKMILTPAASLQEMVRSRVIGSRAAEIADDSPLAKKHPEHAKAADGPTAIPLINALFAAQQQ